jgi:hypothetical protein
MWCLPRPLIVLDAAFPHAAQDKKRPSPTRGRFLRSSSGRSNCDWLSDANREIEQAMISWRDSESGPPDHAVWPHRIHATEDGFSGAGHRSTRARPQIGSRVGIEREMSGLVGANATGANRWLAIVSTGDKLELSSRKRKSSQFYSDWRITSGQNCEPFSVCLPASHVKI